METFDINNDCFGDQNSYKWQLSLSMLESCDSLSLVQ
jgi:hypothetical protein